MTQVIQNGHVIDSATGEMIEDIKDVQDLVLDNRAEAIRSLMAGEDDRFIHMSLARQFGIKPHVVSSYVGSQPDSAKQHLNEKIMVKGAVPYFSGSFTPKDPKKHSGEGFYTFLIKTGKVKEIEYKVGRELKTSQVPVIIKCDGVKVRDTMAELIRTYGPFDWDTEVPVVFTYSEDGAFYMQILPE